MSGCNMFASIATKARGTVNTLGKRNVEFDRPAPAEKDLEGVHTLAIGPLKGDAEHADALTGYLASQLGDSGRFALLDEVPGRKNADEGTAVISGKIIKAEYEEREDSQSAKCGEKTCTTRTRIGTAIVQVDFKLLDGRSGKVLARKTFEDRKESKTSARDSSPPSIDGDAILTEATQKVAGDFFAMLSPHTVTETVFFETDNAAKPLKEGANRALSGDLEGAIQSFEAGLAQAQKKEDAKAVAKAQFDLGLALVIKGEYDDGLALLEQAQTTKSSRSWEELVLSATQWKADAERAQAQWALSEVEPPALDPALRPSESATAEGAKALQTVRSASGV